MTATAVDTVERLVEATIERESLLAGKDHVVIGLSGGADSLCLFDLLWRMAERRHIQLHPVHCHHGLRGEEADRDQMYVEELCRSRGTPCAVFRFDCRKEAAMRGLSTEEAGRILRYQAYEETADRLGLPDKIAIAVGQNADDRAETVLFRLLRGTGPDGLVGMEYARQGEKGRTIIRPLLDVYKSDIRAYCAERALEVREDRTNYESLYARNKIRLDLLPLLARDYNPAIRTALVRLADAAREDRTFLDALAREALQACTKRDEKNAKGLLLDGKRLRALDPALQRRVLRDGFRRLGLWQDISFVHYQAARRLLSQPSPSAEMTLPHGYVIRRLYEDLLLTRRENLSLIPASAGPLKAFSSAPSAYFPSRSNSSCPAAFTCVFDREKLEESLGKGAARRLVIRHRQAGDFIRLPVGRRKVRRLFIDRKIPIERRDRAIVAAIGSELLAILYDGSDPASLKPEPVLVRAAAWPVEENTIHVLKVELTGYI